MRTPAKEFLARNPSYSCVSVDLRGHGMSHDMEGENSIDQCARDLHNLFHHLNIEAPDFLCAHSLGGKVALKYLDFVHENDLSFPTNTWILDSLPGTYDFSDLKPDSQSVSYVIRCLDQIPVPFESRKWALGKLLQLGVATPIAQWLCTSVVDTPNGSKWAFNIDAVKSIFKDFCVVDMWPFVEQYDGNATIHFVRAGRQKKWTPEVLARFNSLPQYNRNIMVHTMPNAGHWLHSEDLSGLLKIIQEHNR
eukprot:CAMPEP_0185018958 /NCGR_PEP_ID=MMETSP1103-20130426/1610_1 /TAXON_ID=36769 /ORGANISM="Paraphysomonas bandaiensis, Strain Caron Lab Isolate" /LENGTH=249 /DNA_ID=CAMNT_0027549013 /DNA_START=227 /DNA_END=976 /DNA_ORIENTATION=-